MNIVANLISLTILFAVPLLLVALGGMFSEHSGVINIALEGMMIIGALFACLTLQAFDQNGFGALHPQLSMFAQQGYVIASVRHRSRRDGFAAPAFLRDCKSALRFLRTNAAAYHIDPDHVCAWGTSSGGNTVLLMGLTGDDPAYRTDEYPDASDAVQAVIDCFGPTDLPELIATLNFDETAETFCNEMFGGSLETHLELLHLPVHHHY